MNKLSRETIQELKKRHKKERDKRVCDRIKAVLLINDGYTYEQIGKILLIDDDSVRRHVQEYLYENKLNNNHKGSNSKLDEAQSKEIIPYLQNNTYLDVRPIISYVNNKYGILYSISGMNTWLKANGFSYKKPHAVPSRHNQAKQDEFIQAITRVKESGELLFYMDAVHPSHQSKLAYGWIYKGSNKALPTTASQKRINLSGVIELSGKSIEIKDFETINSQAVIELLDKIKSKYGSETRLNFVLDNARYQKSILIKQYLLDNKNIIFHYLPAYSPNLNLIERVWKFMHKKVTNNHYYEHFSDFKSAILSFFDNFNDYKNEIESLLTFKFQKLVYNVGNFVK
jgi:transposase